MKSAPEKLYRHYAATAIELTKGPEMRLADIASRVSRRGLCPICLDNLLTSRSQQLSVKTALARSFIFYIHLGRDLFPYTKAIP